MRKFYLMILGLCGVGGFLNAQQTFPINGLQAPPKGTYAFTGATIVQKANVTLNNATMVVRGRQIVAIGTQVAIPPDAVIIDCKGKYLYPSFIDLYTDYGMPKPGLGAGRNPFDFRTPPQLETNINGAYGWNQALKCDQNALTLFVPDASAAKNFREVGFGSVLTHQKDGIARGTGAVVNLSDDRANEVFLQERASAHYSFNKGTSTQSYPSSLMGTIALLRQTYLDANWYVKNSARAGTNITLATWNAQQQLPQIMDPQMGDNSIWNLMRSDRIGDEFGVQYIIKATGKEYQRIAEVAATKAPLILSLSFPIAQDVEDPLDARYVSMADLKHWEMAPGNAAALEKAGISFVLSMSDVKDGKTFWTNLRKAINFGLSESKALQALTEAPARLLGLYERVGSLENGKEANFLIANGPLFSEKTTLLQNWVGGKSFILNNNDWSNPVGKYKLILTQAGHSTDFQLEVKSSNSATVIGVDTLNAQINYDGRQVKIQFAPQSKLDRPSPRSGPAKITMPANAYRLSGMVYGQEWQGSGTDTNGLALSWIARRIEDIKEKSDSVKRKMEAPQSNLVFPFMAFGNQSLPQPQTILFKNATVWTSEKDAVYTETDVLVKQGKIAAIGKALNEPGALVIDGTGKYLTAGIIDEHSHIASASTNEGGQSVTSEVRIGDNINPDDINIYRQLSGGVTTAQILHGSANVIGGQSQLIKLRWGATDQGLKFVGADPFIKFALGENVKRTAFTLGNNRFPDTRMGVEQVMVDAFTRARAYERAMKVNPQEVRRDLELDALVEILNNKRFITCHSYVASEIINTMRIAERFGFRVNTFTHILEGYKVADLMKKHGASASTFSDWWAYKLEVQDAIPYNAYLMNKLGLRVAINSDDAEMARRLNQEAAKAVKYGGLSEQDAWKMVTINPAEMLHIDQKVGSIKVGKEADLVLWNNNPLSIYAKVLYTLVDGTVYFDREKDLAKRQELQAERTRLIQKMVGEKAAGRPTTAAQPSYHQVHTCGDGDHAHKLGLLEIEAVEEVSQEN